ncbi:MAG: type II secretion system inner membrane protein GspF [Bdellovibrionales bacterium]|mgnify:CR=1 FL=1|jgi:general secretion pathway protein F|nr:type II secretion system inner membrane protein GspF [Bdellovibrionales bacterium]MBT3526717.1 type II secretion system inner membrane protein GspF [Bdellovibrionales bacterium]MBT7668434.1 type II secretion system inner membrane protein GspF [Bdellovibrionales bacterium]MBT7767896.1 type II secretion system inner membrane protein GspF [Bdellovibrionales bacterium]
MAIYSYKGINSSGKEIKSTINVETMAQAKQKIRSMGVMLIQIEEQKTDALKKQHTINFNKSIKVTDLALMTRQLSTLIKAKIQIVDALKALIDQSDNPQMRIVLSDIRQKVNEGSSLAKALADYPQIFSNVYVNMVGAGESSGTLEIVLLRLADFTEGQVRLKNKIRGSMIYPLIMIIFGSLMIGIIFIFVIPKITKIFISMKRELPLQTQICIWISNFLQSYWWAIIVTTFVLYFLFKKYIQTTGGRARWDRLLLNLPIIGELVMMVNVSRFCSTLATLLNSSVPILTSLKIVMNLVSNVHMQQAISEAKDHVSEGASMTPPLIKSEIFPSMVTHMISLGERSGELEPMLQIVAENYEDQVNSKLSGLTSVLEPIMMVGMGLAVAFIVFSVVVPMMSLNTIQ